MGVPRPERLRKRKLIPHPSRRPDNARMKRAHLRAHWIGPPSPTGLWIGALLRAVAMLVLYAANFLRTCLAVAERRRRMRPSRLSRECHVDVTPATLPEPKSGPASKGNKPGCRKQPDDRAVTADLRCHRRHGWGWVRLLCEAAGDYDAPIFPPPESPTGLRRGFEPTPHA